MIKLKSVIFAIAIVILTIFGTGCLVNQDNISAADKLSPTFPLPTSPNINNVSYGPEPAQKLDVWLPQGPVSGTMIFYHSGGWISGTEDQVVPSILSETARGWAVVSVGYRKRRMGR